ncbi:MAG TPA: hypothetical protein VN452_04605 [Longilinea sp.]|nr:hypothetical protein [Longilinea sp.]
MDTLISPTARKVMEKARSNHYYFQVVGDHGKLDQPYFKNGWWYVPEDKPIIDQNAIQRIELVRSITPTRGFIIAHEAPKLLCPPKGWETPRPAKVKPVRGRVSLETGVDWSTVGQVALTAAKAVGTVLAAVLYFLVEAIAVFASVDPKLIVILEDGTWMEVMTWYE